jgi:hypothetical protein
MLTSRTASRGPSPVGFEAVGSEPIALSEITTLTSLTDSLLRDYEQLVARSGTGLRSCKEVHAFLKERSVIEATYGNALVRQGRASAGSLERGTCRMGWFAFKSMSESIGRKHLVRPPPTAHHPPPTAHRPPPTAHRPPPTAHRPPPTAHRPPQLHGSRALQLPPLWPKPVPPPLAQELASHYNADCTALQYLRDRLAGAHRSLVAEGTGARPLLAHTCAQFVPGACSFKLVTVASLTPQARSRTHGRAWLRSTRRASATPSSQRASTRQCWRCTASPPPPRCPGGPPSTRSGPRRPARAQRRRRRRRPRPRRALREARSRRRRSS